MRENNIEVSVVMPIYNESQYIRNCVDSLLMQDFEFEKMEWIFVDGNSTDNTKEILSEYIEKYPKLIKILDNPNKTVPYAMNIGIKEAVGKYIIRLDAHSDYANDYITKCVYYLEKLGVDNVGGTLETKGRGFVGGTIAKMLSSKFGVGNSNFRTSTESGYVDTVPFGAFRREVFEKWGYYDERLTRNQDNEMNYRIRKNNGKIYLANDINLSYYCRDTVKGISEMAFQNGKWNIIAMYLCPGSMGIRHFVPLCFVLSIFLLTILSLFFNGFGYLLLAELSLYFLLDIYNSLKISKNYKEIALLFILFPIFHICYGSGSLAGLGYVGKTIIATPEKK